MNLCCAYVNVTAKSCHSIYKIVAHNDETLG